MAVYRSFPSCLWTRNVVISTVSPYPALKGKLPQCWRCELAASSLFTLCLGQEREGTSRQLPLAGQRQRGHLRRHKGTKQIKINRSGGSCFKEIPASSGRALRPSLSIVGNIFRRLFHGLKSCRRETCTLCL